MTDHDHDQCVDATNDLMSYVAETIEALPDDSAWSCVGLNLGMHIIAVSLYMTDAHERGLTVPILTQVNKDVLDMLHALLKEHGEATLQ